MRDRATGRALGSAYLEITKVLRMTDPSEARALLSEAEHLFFAYGFADSLTKAGVLAKFAAAWWGLDDRRASELSNAAVELSALAVQEEPFDLYEDLDAKAQIQATELARIAAVLGPHDPEAARRLLTKATAFASEPDAVGAVAVVLARYNPEGAGRLARRISTSDHHHASFELPRIAHVLAERTPGMARELLAEAELIVRKHLEKNAVPEALARVATPLFAHDVDAARELVAEAERLAFPRGLYFGAWHTPELLGVLAPFDLEHAERIARTLAEPHIQAEAFRAIAVSLSSSVSLQL
ncbi:hypothetical protein [Actinomadura roseirufa]|uniref:hypothetical protein n=1 Tax=Actinomadura roseirufa TaxID=2094049 RepID=UPI001040F44B|nr:hypothetical protein [Actinomadura roseirufa]